MKRTNSQNPWTKEETEKLRSLIAEYGLKYELVGQIMGRSAGSVEHRWRWINITQEERDRRNARERKNNETSRLIRGTAKERGEQVTRLKVPQDVFVERSARLAAPMTISAFVLGDPPIGYSALDRKRQGLSV